MAGAGALHVSRAAKDTYNRCGTWDSLAISTQLRRSCRPVWATTQVQPDDVADQQRPRRWSFYGASGTCPAYSRISFRTWAFTGRLAILPPILGWLTIVADA